MHHKQSAFFERYQCLLESLSSSSYLRHISFRDAEIFSRLYANGRTYELRTALRCRPETCLKIVSGLYFSDYTLCIFTDIAKLVLSSVEESHFQNPMIQIAYEHSK